MPTEAANFSSIDQLYKLLERYPKDPLNIEGLILDYSGQTGARLDQIFEINQKIYKDLFTGPNSEKGKDLLKCLVQSEQDLKELEERCKDGYGNISRLLQEINLNPSARLSSINSFLKDPDAYLGYHISAILWHISDIHFGKFNKIDNDPRELAFIVAKLAADYPKMKPDIVIISGDLSSVSDQKEFRAFVSFCKALGRAIWKEEHPERILVVPGNHDITWLKNGVADKMAKFIASVSLSNCCITPFGPVREDFDNGQVVVKRLDPANALIPQAAEVEYKRMGIRFLLLVSSYFSGVVPENIRQLLRSSLKDEALVDLLRIDEGALDHEYIFNIANLIEPSSLTSIAIIHHNPIQYGIVTCMNKNAPQLLETLGKKNIPLLLHGHTHQVDDPGSQRPAASGISYPVPCPTLSSIPTGGSGRGLNIFFFGDMQMSRKADMILWTLSSSLGFNPDRVVLRYRFNISENEIEVKHGEGIAI